MLKKIIGIKNVGRFAECGGHGDVEFRQKTYLFAENGRGKSTLCAILRSLQSGDGAIITGRKRLGQIAAPEVTLRLKIGLPHTATEPGTRRIRISRFLTARSCTRTSTPATWSTTVTSVTSTE